MQYGLRQVLEYQLIIAKPVPNSLITYNNPNYNVYIMQ